MQFIRTCTAMFLSAAMLFGPLGLMYAGTSEYKKDQYVFGDYFVTAKGQMTKIKNLVDQQVMVPFNKKEKGAIAATQLVDDDVKKALSSLQSTLRLTFYQRVAALDTALNGADDEKKSATVLAAYVAFNDIYKQCLENLDMRTDFLCGLQKQGIDTDHLPFEQFNLRIGADEVAAAYNKAAHDTATKQQKEQQKNRHKPVRNNNNNDDADGDEESFLSMIDQHGLFSGGLQWVRQHPWLTLGSSALAMIVLYGIGANLFGWWPYHDKN